ILNCESAQPNEREWDVELVCSMFNEDVACNINTMPLLESVTEDSRCWWPDSRVWNLEVSPVVKNFLWRMLRDCLPTRSL
ncbi:hypothetical protein A2U01_0056967, partial [Trifolium medium]|nr:hypothetical protein [Trifolium medium]